MATASTNTLLARTSFIGGGELLYNLAPVDPVAGVLEAVLGQSEAIRVLCHFGIQKMESNIKTLYVFLTIFTVSNLQLIPLKCAAHL